MIKFTKEIEGYNFRKIKFNELKLGKNRLIKLEHILRQIGNFDSKKDILIDKEEYIGNSDFLYETIDLDNTNFKFYNFGLGYGSDIERYNKNFLVTMKRQNNNIEYTYSFANDNHDFYIKEINYLIDQDKIVQFQFHQYLQKLNCIQIKEKEKTYKINLKVFSDYDITILSKFWPIITYVKNLKAINMKNILSFFNDFNEIQNCGVKLNNYEAILSFANNQINGYIIKKEDYEKKVNFNDTITKEVKREKLETVKMPVTDIQSIQKELTRIINYM